MQKTFGKTTGDLETMVEGFAYFLADQKIEDVIAAIEKYVRRNSDIPTPSDILAIICPVVEPWKPDWDYYRNMKELLQSGGSYALGDEEMEYIRACERHALDRFQASKNN